jgi:hypothetical protein
MKKLLFALLLGITNISLASSIEVKEPPKDSIPLIASSIKELESHKNVDFYYSTHDGFYTVFLTKDNMKKLCPYFDYYKYFKDFMTMGAFPDNLMLDRFFECLRPKEF